MCRIAGILAFDKNKPTDSRIKQMTDAMRRGGPDDSGCYVDAASGVAFGHRRLSIIDLTEMGHQPMQDEQQELVICYNGEIYNFQDIKTRLISLGHHFISNSDTEVILYAFRQWGTDCFNMFNGMFAFALFDKRSLKVYLVRDYAGIKPLYYSFQDGELIFASEIRAFKALNSAWQENPDWKKYFLLFGFLPEPVTTLQGIQALPKGSYLEYDIQSKQSAVRSYFKLSYNYSITDEAEAVERLRATLTNSVARHLISDAPIGLFLSGGTDSSLLTLLAQSLAGSNLKTLSIYFEDEKFSEKKYQDIIIRQSGVQHHSFLVTQDEFTSHLPDILEAMDQPSCDGINSYFISKYARQYGLTAVLSGLGADEIFGGYPSFYRADKIRMLKLLPDALLGLARYLPDERIRRISLLSKKSLVGDYLLSRGCYSVGQTAKLLGCDESEVRSVYEKSLGLFPDMVNSLVPQEQVSFWERECYMQNQLLKDTDYMSMWQSIEVRVPFLDKELLELVYSIHPSIRYNKQQKKHLLIKAFSDILPEEIWNRSKQGFTFPFENWMKNIAPVDAASAQQHSLLVQNKIHWSRYWCYLLTTDDFRGKLKITGTK